VECANELFGASRLCPGAVQFLPNYPGGLRAPLVPSTKTLLANQNSLRNVPYRTVRHRRYRLPATFYPLLNRSVLGKNSDDVVVSIVTYASELVEEKGNTDHLSGFLVASLERLQDGAHVCAGYRPCPGCAQSRFVFFSASLCCPA